MESLKEKESKLMKDYRQSYDEFEQSELCHDGAWLCAERREAFDRFEEKGFPSLKDEGWRYTNLETIKKILPHKQEIAVITQEVIQPYILDISWPRAVFVNGRFQPNLSYGISELSGVRIMSLAQALKLREPAVEKNFREETLKVKSLVNLNTAFFTDGIYLELGEQITMEKPLQVLSLFSFNGCETAVNTRNILWARKGSQGKIVQTIIDLGEKDYFANDVSSVLLDEGAMLEHYVLKQGGSSGLMTSSCNATLSSQSRYQVTVLSSDMRFFRNELEVSLRGAGAHVVLKGLYLTQGREHIDQNILIEHCVPDCTSDQVLKGIVDGASRLVLRGKVHVLQDAQRTAASQTMRTLMLSESAVVDAKPELEIFADDVKCSHGTAIGQIEGDAVFYLQSRGIGADQAKQILTRAFAMQIIETINLECVMGAAEKALQKHFGNS